ncbi:hypothetical protein Tco_0742481 [Tanacetum coccineum]
MKSQQSTNAFVKETFMDLKTQLETVAKNHQASIQNLETKFDRLADKQSGRPSGSLPSNTQPNPKGHNSKAYQPPQSRNEHVNVVWNQMKGLAGLSNVVGGYKEVVDYLIPLAKRRACSSVIAKLVFSASVYYISQERNARLFSNQKRTITQLSEKLPNYHKLEDVCSKRLAFSKATSALALPFVVPTHPSGAKVIEPEPLTLEFEFWR